MRYETDDGATDRPYPARTGRLPRHLDQVTPEWLTSLLANRYPGIVVEGFGTVDVKNSHTTKLRIEMDLNDIGRDAGIPRNVCLKSNWSLGVGTGNICEQEARFYHLMAGGLGGPLPKSYYADWDGDGGGRGIVVMEDLAVSEGSFGSSTDHLGIDGVAAGLESLAQLHAALWNSPRLARETWLAGSMDTPVDTEQVITFHHYIRHNLEKQEFRDAVPSWVEDEPERLNHILDELSAYEREHQGPRCLVHGDAHQGNSFLRADGQRIWVDWQLVRKGSPWRDVSYFIVGSLTIEERRSAERSLLNLYRELLEAAGATDVPDEAAAWESFRRWPAYGMQSWLGNMDHWGQSGAEMVRRTWTAAQDYDTIDLLTAGKPLRRHIDPSQLAPPLALGQDQRSN